MSQTSLCVATAIATVNWMKETLISCVRPNHHYFHSRVSRSSIYLIKYRSCQSNLCHGAFGVCSCRSHLNMVGIRKSFHVPGSGCRPWPLWALWESHILPPCLLSTPRCLHSHKRKASFKLTEVLGVSARSTTGMKAKCVSTACPDLGAGSEQHCNRIQIYKKLLTRQKEH